LQRLYLAQSLHRSFRLKYEEIKHGINADIKEAGARLIASRGRKGIPYLDSQSSRDS